MKAYIEPAENNDTAVNRVRDHLIKYAPKRIEIVDRWDKADLVVMNVNGRLNRTTRRIKAMQKRGIKYAIIQYCLKSTLNKQAKDWINIWEDSELVWSYLDIEKACHDEKLWVNFPFYYSPLGVDKEVFYPRGNQERDYLIITHSKGYLSETTRETFIAANRVGGKVAHLGENLGRFLETVDYYTDVSDEELAALYSRCKYVAALRRTEGFELPAAEGLLCGARPLVYRQTHYIKWYGDVALTIPETERGQIIVDLERAFKLPYRYILRHEIYRAQLRFDWKGIVEGFWAWL